MSVEFSGAGFTPEPNRQEQQPGLRDLEQTMQAVRETIQTDSAARLDHVQATSELSAEDIAEAAEEFAQLAQSLNRDLRFNVESELDTPIIRVIDRSSGEMIRQIPTEEVVELALKIRQYNSDDSYDSATGLFINSKV